MSFTEDLHREGKMLSSCFLFGREGDRIVNDLTRWLMPGHVRQASSLYTFTLNQREEKKKEKKEMNANGRTAIVLG